MVHQPKGILGGPGFYAVLVLCLAAVGTSAYLVLFRGNTDASPAPAQTEVTAPAPDLSQPDLSVDADARLPEDSAASASVTMPEEPVEKTDDTPVAAEAPNLIVSPLSGSVVAAFSEDQLAYNETLDDWRTHDGVDIAAAQGTKVLAACSGTVVSVENDDLLGTTVVVRQNDGCQSTYANLQAKPTVAKGDAVSAGQVIGAVGATSIAESAEGPHLHFSVSRDGTPIDPESYLKK